MTDETFDPFAVAAASIAAQQAAEAERVARLKVLGRFSDDIPPPGVPSSPRVWGICRLAGAIMANGHIDYRDYGQEHPMRFHSEAELGKVSWRGREAIYVDFREAFRLVAAPVYDVIGVAHAIDLEVGKVPRTLHERTRLERTEAGWVVTIEDGTPEEAEFVRFAYEDIAANMLREMPTREETDTWLKQQPPRPAPGDRPGLWAPRPLPRHPR